MAWLSSKTTSSTKNRLFSSVSVLWYLEIIDVQWGPFNLFYMPVFSCYACSRAIFNTQSHSFYLDKIILMVSLSCQYSPNPSEFCKHLIKLNVAWGGVRL